MGHTWCLLQIIEVRCYLNYANSPSNNKLRVVFLLGKRMHHISEATHFEFSDFIMKIN